MPIFGPFRRRQLEEALTTLRRQPVDEGVVCEALAHIGEVYECLPPYRRKDLIHLVLEKAEISETQLTLNLKGRPPSVEVLKRGDIERLDASRSETSKWLPGPNSNLSRSVRTAKRGD